MSGATAWKPASASAASWWRQEYQDSGKPWHMMTSGPVPCSATCMRMPLVSTVRWVISLISSLLLGHHGHHALHDLGIAVDAAGLEQVLDLGVQLVNGRIPRRQLRERQPELDRLLEVRRTLAAGLGMQEIGNGGDRPRRFDVGRRLGEECWRQAG